MLDVTEQGNVIRLCAGGVFSMFPKTRTAERGEVKVFLTSTVMLWRMKNY